MQLWRRWTLALCSIVVLAAAPANLDTLIEQARQAWHAPGVAVGILQDGQVVLEKGYGLRDVRHHLPVTPRTLFAMGSVTKSFTATIAAMLVDEGKLDLDRPVREYLPWFRLSDPVASEQTTMRDLLTHRSGMPRHDFIRFAVPLSRRELVERLRFLEFSKPFRSTYQYNNLMYVTAGYLEGVLADSSWEQLVQDRIFTPLSMRDSNTSVLDSQKSADYARPYELVKGAAEEVPFYVYQEFGVGPNGAVNSTLEDMLRYLEFLVRDGQAGGRQLVSAARMREMHSPQMVAAVSRFAEIGPADYGLAWTIQTYRGHHMIEHGGSINGFRSWLGYLPRDRIGIVVLSNLGSNLPEALSLTLADRLLGLDPIDWTARLKTPPVAPRQPPARQPDTRPSHELADYAGDYAHPAYGTLRVEVTPAALQIAFPKVSFSLQHYHYDVFQADSGMLVQFHMNEAGRIRSVAMPLEPAVQSIIFTRKP